jgi:fluoride exporter
MCGSKRGSRYKPPIMTRFLLVGLGGAIGSAARYGLGEAAARWLPGATWPWAVFAVNVLGGGLMGLLAGWLAGRGGGEGLRLFAAVGVLGGFTTFSAFSLDLAAMLQRRDWGMAAAYAVLSVALATLALFAGLWLARKLWT